MHGTVTIVAAPAAFGRAGRLKLSVDGAVVGKVRQGSSLDVTLEAGTHHFRVSSGGCRSKNVAISVSDGSQQFLDAGVHHGLLPAAGLCAAVLGYFTGVLLVLPLALILMATPGSWFYLRASTPHPSSDALEDVEEAVATATATAGEMWWVNDPNLAKRYRQP